MKTRSKRISTSKRELKIEGAKRSFWVNKILSIISYGNSFGIFILFLLCLWWFTDSSEKVKQTGETGKKYLSIRSVVKSWNSLWKKILWKLGPLRARGRLSKGENWRIHDKFSTAIAMARLVIKFSFSREATKIWRNLPLALTFT